LLNFIHDNKTNQLQVDNITKGVYKITF